MFKRTISLDKKLFERKPLPSSSKHNSNDGTSLDAGKDKPNAGENLTKVAKPPQNAGTVNIGKPPKGPGKTDPNAGTCAPIESAMILEELDNDNKSTAAEKPVMTKTMSMSSSTDNDDDCVSELERSGRGKTKMSTDNDDDVASVSDLERSGRRKTKMYTGVSEGQYTCLWDSLVATSRPLTTILNIRTTIPLDILSKDP
jgi:hypothetical protein